MKSEIPYISIEKSNAIKGGAILLIILGHNHILCPEHSLLFSYLYSFHIAIFFILPFFYNQQLRLDKNSIHKIVKRTYIPFLWFFFFCLVINYLFYRRISCWYEIAFGIFSIGGYGCRDTCGFVFPWFLPAFCMMSLLRVFASKYKLLNVIFLIIGLICMIDYLYFTRLVIFKYYNPFYVIQACYYYTLGLLSVWAFRYIPQWKYIGVMIFILLSILVYTGIVKSAYIPYLFSLTGFVVAYWISGKLTHIKVLVVLGKNSMYIYLLHVFIYNGLERLFPHTFCMGIMTCTLTILISLMCAWGVKKNPVINKYVFGK